MFRRSHLEVFLEKAVLKICGKFGGENMQQIYRRKPMPKKLYGNHTLAWVSPVNLLLIFRTLYIAKFTPHFMCWKYFDEIFVDENLLHTSLTKINKLNQRKKRTFLITQFTFALYLVPFSAHFQFIFGGSFDQHTFPYKFLDSTSK